MSTTKTREESPVLHKNDIQLVDPDVLVLGQHRFYRPFVTAAAINEDTVPNDGTLGSVRLAQETARQYSRSTGLPATEDRVFVISDDAAELWDALKKWIKKIPIQVLEVRLPNKSFTSLFER